MHDSAPCGRRRNATKIAVLERDFRAAIFDCVFPETLSDDIHKRLVFVDMTPFVSFGKGFAKMASVRILQSLSKFEFTGATYIISAPKLQEKFSAVEVSRKLFDALINHVAGIFVAVFAIFFRHVLFVAVAKDKSSVVSQAVLFRRRSEIFGLNHLFVEQAKDKAVDDGLAEKFH